MSDLQVDSQRLTAIERDVSFLAQMVGLVIVDQVSRADMTRLAELGNRHDLVAPVQDEPGPPDDLSRPARPA